MSLDWQNIRGKVIKSVMVQVVIAKLLFMQKGTYEVFS
jgi:hypothetical protein